MRRLAARAWAWLTAPTIADPELNDEWWVAVR